MEKKGPGLMSTLTNTAVRAKRSRMISRLPRIRTVSGMLLIRRARVGTGWAQARQGKVGKSPLPGLHGGGWERCERSVGRMGGLPWAQMELPQQGRGRDTQGWPGTKPKGGSLTTGTERS